MQIDPSMMVTIETFESIQDALDNALVSDRINVADYEREWLSLLESVGWTMERYASEIDRRWDYIDYLRLRERSRKRYWLN